MDEIEKFIQDRNARIDAYPQNQQLQETAAKFMEVSVKAGYSYNFTWMGRPIIQYPQDMLAVQEIVWAVKPDLIIETGVAHGGSLIFSASLLEMMGIEGQVLGLDIDIRSHNYGEIVRHPMYKRITLLEGSSIDEKIACKVREFAKGKQRILVMLDSNHTHDHVLRELQLYAPLVTKNSYCIVFDTIVEFMAKGHYSDRPWDVGNSPYTAAQKYLKENPDFVVDECISNKLLISVAPSGYLKRVR